MRTHVETYPDDEGKEIVRLHQELEEMAGNKTVRVVGRAAVLISRSVPRAPATSPPNFRRNPP